VVVLFAVNILFTQRLLRALHPNFGWNPIVSKLFIVFLASVVGIIISNIISTTASFYSLDPASLKISRGFIEFGSFYTFFLSVFPVLVLLPAAMIPGPIERFGVGPFRFKVLLLMFGTAFLAAGSITRLIATVRPRPKDMGGPNDSKLVFYITGFTLEIIVVAMYAICRIDLIFHVPDGCTKPGDYAAGYTPKSDEEEFFQDIDVKMRMSTTSLEIPPEAWINRSRDKIEEVDRASYESYKKKYERQKSYNRSRSSQGYTAQGSNNSPLAQEANLTGSTYMQSTRSRSSKYEQPVATSPQSLTRGARSALVQQAMQELEDELRDIENEPVPITDQQFVAQDAKIAVVQQAMRELELKSGIEGQYLDTGDSDVMLYAFKIKKEKRYSASVYPLDGGH
jgi:hypothetical protein